MASHIFLNSSAASCHYGRDITDPGILRFHQKLPDFANTPLIPLPTVASELGLGKVFLKDESQRFGLPSFKILGASWAIYRVVGEKCGLGPKASFDEVGKAAREKSVQLVGQLHLD